MKKLLFIVNLQAGKGEMRRVGMECIDVFVRAGYEVTVFTTQRTQQATELVQAHGAQYDRIVCAGGDGTLNEVVTGMLESGLRIPLGYLPSGTTNDFASSLQLPRAPIQAAITASAGKPYEVDVGKFGDKYFSYIAAFGAFTDVPYNTPQQFKNAVGRLAYVLEGAKTIPNIKQYAMRCQADERIIEGKFVFGMVSNTTSVGGLRELGTDHVHMDDGLFEVVLVRLPTTPSDWQRALLELTNPEMEWTNVIRCKASKIIFNCEDQLPWTLDGEFGGRLQEVTIQNLPRALQILVS